MCKVRNRRLQSVKAIVERQQYLPPEGDRQRLFFLAENIGARLLRTHPVIFYTIALLSLGNSLGIFAVEAADRCIAARTECVVVVLPWSIWPIDRLSCDCK